MSAERTPVEAADAVEGLARVLAPYYAEPLRALIEHARAAGVMSHHPYDTAGHLPGDMSPAEAADGLAFLAEDERSILSPVAQAAMRVLIDHARAVAHLAITRDALIAAARAEGVDQLAAMLTADRLGLIDEEES